MNLQDLKDNRTQIIAEINRIGCDVTETMGAMVKWLGFNDLRSTDVIAYVSEVINLAKITKQNTIDISASVWLSAKNKENAMSALPSSMR